MKYIDAEKLKAEVERRIEEINIECQKSRRPQFSLYGKINGLEQTLNLVRALQQEHLPDAGKMVEQDHIADVSKMVEQPEVDLEKEMDRYFDDLKEPGIISPYACRAIARHFYELGLKARKEESK